MGVRIEATRYKRQPDYWTFDVIEDGEVICSVRAAGPTDPRGREVAERILAAINGDTVPAPTLPESPEDLGGLVTRLWQWKAEATEVIAGWERVWDAMGRPGQLGKSKSDGCLEALAAAPTLPDDLPSWVSMHATATGADLIEHDPNGDEWERWVLGRWVLGEWRTDHAKMAVPGLRCLVRRRSAPMGPATEKVSWWEAFVQQLPIAEWNGQTIKNVQHQSSGMFLSTHGLLKVLRVDADGMVTVLREDGAS